MESHFVINCLQNTNFHNVASIHLESLNVGPGVKFAPVYKFFVNLELTFQKIHYIYNAKITFFKDICICGELC